MVDLPKNIGFTLEQLCNVAKSLHGGNTHGIIGVKHIKGALQILCPKVYPYYHQFGDTINAFNDGHYWHDLALVNKLSKQLRKCTAPMHVYKKVGWYLYRVIIGHCKYTQSNSYVEKELETNDNEVLRVASVFRTMTHRHLLLSSDMLHAMELLFPNFEWDMKDGLVVDVNTKPKYSKVCMRNKLKEFGTYRISLKTYPMWIYICNRLDTENK